MNKTVKIRLHVISPIHIGCDDVYEPTSFVIDEKKKKLIEFDPMEFVKALTPKEREELNKIACQDNLLALFKTIKRLYKPEIKGREIEITDYLIEHYKKILNMSTFNKKTIINQFTIYKTAYIPQTNLPYIPGSSLKGSLRTGYLSRLANASNIKHYWKKSIHNMSPHKIYERLNRMKIADALESELLNRAEGKEKIPSDPFRLVKISDLMPGGDVKTRILYAVNRKKQKSNRETLAGKGSVYQIFEIIEAGSIFEGTLTVDKPLNGSPVRHKIDLEALLLSAHKHYTSNLKEEITPIHESLGIRHRAGINANSRFNNKFKKTAFLIRIGKHSGAEAVTIEGNRYIQIRQGKDRPSLYLDHATTFWLASDNPRSQDNNDLIPFGWAVLEVV